MPPSERIAENPSGQRTIWIDLDNTPHVPFFAPIVRALRERNFRIVITARQCFQVCALADMFDLHYEAIGYHYGRFTALKVLGLCQRASQLVPFARRVKPDLALSHGSRAQLLASIALGIPSTIILDYEHAKFVPFLAPTWVIAPEVIPDAAISFERSRIKHYPGIKEDVYAPTFKADENLRVELNISDNSILVTARPPANEAHYYTPESDLLFRSAIRHLASSPDVKIVVLPRNKSQDLETRRSWNDLIMSGKMIIPGKALDGLNLIWNSDLVVSGGGTMNREAAALGVPVYSVFRGSLGAVDRTLAANGRLTLIECVDDVRSKLKVARKKCDRQPLNRPSAALSSVVELVSDMADPQRGSPASVSVAAQR